MSEAVGTLLPAEPALYLNDEQMRAFHDTFASPTRRSILAVDHLPLANEEKHALVKGALINFGVAQLQHSVKETRSIPPEAIALAADFLISFIVSAIRSASGGAE